MALRVGALGLASAALICIASAGCAGPDGEEGVTSPPQSSVSTTVEPTDEVSPTPDLPEIAAPTPGEFAGTDDHNGAIDSAAYFLELYGYMRQTGDTSEFEAMSGDECVFCASALEATTEVYDRGGWVEGGGTSVDLETAEAGYPTDEVPYYQVALTLTEASSVIHYADGTTQMGEEATVDAIVGLQYQAGRFSVVGVKIS